MYDKEQKLLQSIQLQLSIMTGEKALPRDLIYTLEVCQIRIKYVEDERNKYDDPNYYDSSTEELELPLTQWEQGVMGWNLIPPCSSLAGDDHVWNNRTSMFPRKCDTCGYTDYGPPSDKLECLELKELKTSGYEPFVKKSE